jgi:hypothetical protein
MSGRLHIALVCLDARKECLKMLAIHDMGDTCMIYTQPQGQCVLNIVLLLLLLLPLLSTANLRGHCSKHQGAAATDQMLPPAAVLQQAQASKLLHTQAASSQQLLQVDVPPGFGGVRKAALSASGQKRLSAMSSQQQQQPPAPGQSQCSWKSELSALTSPLLAFPQVDLNAVKPSDLYPELQYEMQVCLGSMLPDYWPTYKSWEEVAANLLRDSNFPEQAHMFDTVRLRMQRIVAEDRAVAQAARTAAAQAAQKAARGQKAQAQALFLTPSCGLQMQSSVAPSATQGLGLTLLQQHRAAEQGTLAAATLDTALMPPVPAAALALASAAPVSSIGSYIVPHQVQSFSPGSVAVSWMCATPALQKPVPPNQQGDRFLQPDYSTGKFSVAPDGSAAAADEDDDLNDLLRVLGSDTVKQRLI